jgi:hypothetical protein
MLELDETILVQFFQHAHHRAEGFLMDFQEGLEEGTVDDALLERAAQSIRQHMYVEEELLFPLVEARLAAPIADLQDDHGRVMDLLAEVRTLIGEGATVPPLQQAATRLMNFLAAHSAKEDMGVYPDLVDLLGVARTRALLADADGADPGPGWVCRRRRAAA